jgi:glycosyltransferase involved in cell wall biosynthesis
MENKFKVLAIITDLISKNGKKFKKKGKPIHGAIGWYRVVNPLKRLGADISLGMTVRADPQSATEMKARGDIWFLKMADNEGIDYIYDTHKNFTGAKLIIDIDDEPGEVDENHPDSKAIKEKKDMRMRMLKIADHIVVSTPKLKESIKDINPYCTVIPNAIDPDLWKIKNKLKKDGKIRIGWMASASHFVDTPIIRPAMEEILSKYPNVEFHFAGFTWDEYKEDRFFHHVGVRDYMDFPKWYAKLGIDISVCPLKDNKFNQAKSNIKWMEAAMLEIPTIASDTEPYKCIKHGKTGYLAKNSNDFVKYLSYLIENEEKRREIGQNAKQAVLDEWTTDKFTHLYKDLFKNIVDFKEIAVVTAITGDKDDLIEQTSYQGVEYIAFTDQKSSQWKTRKPCDKFKEPVMNAKIHKILTHKYTDLPYIVWMDGNCKLKQDPHELIKLMGDEDFAFFTHPGRDCIYDEADTCVQLKKGNPKELAEQIREYAKQEHAPHSGLCELTCFIRKNNPKSNLEFEKWWAEICRYSNRDQVSFPLIFKYWETIPGTVAKIEGNKTFVGNDFFEYRKHKLYD